ncbi:MAG TPA: hypothetical protein ENN13_00695 [Candidatus Altiarchaeales archaeon]|nr:hypothetical protein [Candidatus Altiarchaeales archaeon]
MNVDLTLSLPDRPGMLLKAIEPISSCGGNILSLHHKRGSGKGPVPVEVLFKVRDQESLELILKELKRQKISVKEARFEGRQYFKRKSISLLLIGHVIDRDIQGTIDALNGVGMVSDIDVRMADPDEESSVWMNIEVEERKLKTLEKALEKIVSEKRFLAIGEPGVLS